ncbi:hypothetical protein BDQ12DRAFT_676967 [Crucibulum laeve]|uniref:Uncharacterized protein n=1 Tax=Crucibulum laeve TaxID=68775 RepID=A0A5C3MBV9_9AGAR|nr:hypothetical protein BDQ12DRAFT_676967 [Crucibulum laeve]
MRTESVEHFNILVDLEEEYAVHSRRLLVGVDNFQKASQDVFQCVGDIIQDHNRRSLCKKFPTKLFAKPLPTFVVEPESAE